VESQAFLQIKKTTYIDNTTTTREMNAK